MLPDKTASEELESCFFALLNSLLEIKLYVNGIQN